jgi:hypothetical protein
MTIMRSSTIKKGVKKMKKNVPKYVRSIVSACLSIADKNTIETDFYTSSGPLPKHIKTIGKKLYCDGFESTCSSHNIVTVYEDLIVSDNSGVEEIFLPELQYIAGALIIEDCPKLKKIIAPKLTHIGLYMDNIVENGLLQMFVGAQLSDTYKLSFRNLPSLKSIDIPLLRYVMLTVQISSIPSLSKLKIGNNITVGKEISIDGCSKSKTKIFLNSFRRLS